MKSRKTRNIFIAASAIMLAPAAFALDGTWNTTVTPSSWNTPGNWLADTADGAGFTANFNTLNTTADTTINLDVDRTIGNLIFGDTDTTSAGSWILAAGTPGGKLTLSGTTPTITVNALGTGKNTQITTTLEGTSGFTKAGAGTLVLNNNTNTISGAVVVSGGTLSVQSKPLTNVSSVALNAGTLVCATITGNAIGPNNDDVTISFNGGNFQYNVSSPATDYSARFSTDPNQQYRININGANTVTFSSNLSSVGGTLTKLGTGTLALAAANTFSGATTVSGGTLELSNPLALENSPINTAASIAGTTSAGLVLTGVTSPTFGGLTGGKALASLIDTDSGNYGSVTNVTLNPGTGADITYTGVIADGAAGMTLTKTGAGKQTLNAVNLYTGSTILNGGTLNYSNASALSSGTISYTGGTILQAGVAATLANAISVDFVGVGTVATNGFDTTISGPITGIGTLAKTSAGVLTLTGGEANTIAGGFRVSSGGRLVVPDGKSLTNTGPVTVLSGGSLDYSKDFGNGNNLTNSLTLSGPGDGTLGALNLRGNVTATGTITLDADATISHNFDNATISNSITGTDRNLTLRTLTTGTPQPGMTVSGPISLGTGGITVTGVANSGGFSIKLTGDNTYSGGTVVTSGILLVSNTTGSGTGSGAVSVNTGAAIGGSGTIAGTLSVPSGATLVPGNFNIGTLTVGGNTVIAGTYRCGIDGTSKDMLAVTGDLNVTNGTLEVVELGLGADQASYIIASYTGTLTGTLALSAPVTGYNLVHDTTNKQIRLDAVGGGDSYATWATDNGIPGEPFDEDFNNDGISNGVAYALGLSPTASSQPAGVLTGTTITFNKGSEAITNADVSWIIEVSETLQSGSWTDQVTQAAGNPAGTISYDLAAAPGTPKKFARLKVVKTP